MRALVAIALAVGALVGGLLALRASARTGMPRDDVIARAERRERELRAREAQDEEREQGPQPRG